MKNAKNDDELKLIERAVKSTLKRLISSGALAAERAKPVSFHVKKIYQQRQNRHAK